MKKIILLLILIQLCHPAGIQAQSVHPLQVKEIPAWVANAFTVAQKQSEAMYKEVMKDNLLPRSIQRGMVPQTDWTAGFFPGTLWYLYTYNHKEVWKNAPKQPQL